MATAGFEMARSFALALLARYASSMAVQSSTVPSGTWSEPKHAMPTARHLSLHAVPESAAPLRRMRRHRSPSVKKPSATLLDAPQPSVTCAVVERSAKAASTATSASLTAAHEASEAMAQSLGERGGVSALCVRAVAAGGCLGWRVGAWGMRVGGENA